MAKDPAFLFYPNDYIGGTMGMTFEEKGAYIELLMMQFNRGRMTEHMIRQTVGQLWDNIQVKFKQDDKGMYYNERLEIEKEKRLKFTESRRNNISGINQYSSKKKKKAGHMGGQVTSHMENENINEDINKNVSVNNIEERQKIFKKEVESFSNKYSLNMLTAFYAYWSEPNQNGKKMRKEMQQTWETGRRLITWNNRDKK